MDVVADPSTRREDKKEDDGMPKQVHDCVRGQTPRRTMSGATTTTTTTTTGAQLDRTRLPKELVLTGVQRKELLLHSGGPHTIIDINNVQGEKDGQFLYPRLPREQMV